MRKLLPVVAVAASLVAGAALAQQQAAPAAAPAAPAAAAAAAGKMSAQSSLLTLYKNDKAKAVLKKHIPQVVDFLDSNGTDMIPPEMKLSDLTSIAEAGVTPEMVTAIDKDLQSL